MNIVGALVRVHRLQVHDVPDHVVLVADPVASQHALHSRAIAKALPQLFLFSREIISGTILPSSLRRPSWRQEWRPRVISVTASASFFWISWFAAKGLPNWFLPIV